MNFFRESLFEVSFKVTVDGMVLDSRIEAQLDSSKLLEEMAALGIEGPRGAYTISVKQLAAVAKTDLSVSYIKQEIVEADLQVIAEAMASVRTPYNVDIVKVETAINEMGYVTCYIY